MTPKGVKTVKKKYGENYFSELGKKGAKKFYELYYLHPVGTSQFGIFKKFDNSFVNYLG